MTNDERIENKLNEILSTAVAAKRAVNARTLAFVVILIFLAVIQGIQLRQGRDIKSITKSTNDNSQAIQRATSPEAQARSSANIAGYLTRLSIENDCRSRRQQARMAAPEPGRACDQQTPADIYPGIAGVPARG